MAGELYLPRIHVCDPPLQQRSRYERRLWLTATARRPKGR